MKTTFSIFLSFLLFLSGAFAGSPVASDRAPTADDVREQILPPLVRNEITIIHLAGLDCDEKPQILDLETHCMDHWSEPNFYDVSFRTQWKATEDVYTKQFLSGIPTGEVWLLRCGQAGRHYSIRWEGIFVERQTVPDDQGKTKTVFEISESSLSTIEWDTGKGGWPFGTRSCWEARAACTGETLRFFDSPSEISTSAGNEKKDEWKVSSGSSAPVPASRPTPTPKPEPDEEKHPCFPCWFGDLYGTCSDPDCPNYGNPHSKYKGGGTPSPRKRKKKNNGKASAP